MTISWICVLPIILLELVILTNEDSRKWMEDKITNALFEGTSIRIKAPSSICLSFIHQLRIILLSIWNMTFKPTLRKFNICELFFIPAITIEFFIPILNPNQEIWSKQVDILLFSILSTWVTDRYWKTIVREYLDEIGRNVVTFSLFTNDSSRDW